MIKIFEKIILENFEKWFSVADGGKPAALDFVKIQASEAWRNPKISFIVFAGAKPVCVVKTVRDKNDNAAIDQCWTALSSASRLLAGTELALSVPRPLFFGEHESRKFYIEDFIGGQRLSDGKEADFQSAWQWLGKFYFLAGKTAVNVPAKKYFEDMITDFISSFKVGEEFENFLRQELAVRLGDEEKVISVFPQHGDLTPDNIIMRDRLTQAIDWDNYGKITLPGFDALTLAERWQKGINMEQLEKMLAELNIAQDMAPLIYFGYVLLSWMRKAATLKQADLAKVKTALGAK
jgi:hypothetical protein